MYQNTQHEVYHLNEDWALFEPEYRRALEALGATPDEIEALLDGAWQAVTECRDVEELAAAELQLLREKEEEEN